MKKYTLLFFLVFMTVMSYSNPDAIVGVWMEDKGTGKTEFYKVGENEYKGICVWLKNNVDKNGGPLKDRKNPDKSKRSQYVVGSHVMNISYNPETKKYMMDWAYDPSLGIAVDDSGYMTIDGDTMTIRAGWAFIRVTKHMYKEN